MITIMIMIIIVRICSHLYGCFHLLSHSSSSSLRRWERKPETSREKISGTRHIAASKGVRDRGERREDKGEIEGDREGQRGEKEG